MASNDSDPDAPLIGITTYLEQTRSGVWDVRASFLPEVYIDAVTDAGGIAILLPPQAASRVIAERVLAGLDGLIVAGGADVDPARYGQEPHERTGAPRVDRDAWEDALLTTAIATELPFLGICRGAQMLNVSLGGTLIQHLPEVVGSEKYQPAPGRFGPVEVATAPGSAIATLIGDRVPVHVYHHQAIDELAEGLTVTARSEDGIIEAVELSGVPFGLAVQWHPEEDAADRRLFAGLVDAARTHRTRRSGEDA